MVTTLALLRFLLVACQAAGAVHAAGPVRLIRMPTTATLLAPGMDPRNSFNLPLLPSPLKSALMRDHSLAQYLSPSDPVIALPMGRELHLIPRDIQAGSLMIAASITSGEPRLVQVSEPLVAELKDMVARGDFASAYIRLGKYFNSSESLGAQETNFISTELTGPPSRQRRTASHAPPLMVIGEVHDDPSHNAIRNRLIEAALSREITLGIEGATRSNSAGLTRMLATRLSRARRGMGARILGIETEEVHALTGLIRLFHLFYRDESPSAASMLLERLFLPLLDVYPSTRQAWLDARKSRTSDTPLTRIDKNLELIDGYVETSEKKLDAMPKMLLAQVDPFLTDWNEVLYHFAFYYADYIRRTRAGFAIQWGDKRFGEELRNALLFDPDNFVVTWRNQYFADEIARVYEAGRRAKKPAAIIVGARHLAGLKTLLRKRLPNVSTRFIDLASD